MDILNKIGRVGGVPLKYGAQRGLLQATVDIYMAASEVIKAASGRFVTIDSSGNGTITGAASTTIFAFIEAAEQTCSSTARGTVLPGVVNYDTIFRIPVNNAATAGGSAALWNAIIGKKLDLRVDSNIQGLDADVTTRGHVIVVNADPWVSAVAGSGVSYITDATGCRWVDVKINPGIAGK